MAWPGPFGETFGLSISAAMALPLFLNRPAEGCVESEVTAADHLREGGVVLLLGAFFTAFFAEGVLAADFLVVFFVAFFADFFAALRVAIGGTPRGVVLHGV